MRLTDRLLQYLSVKAITVYNFEKTCGIGNGYLGKQAKGKGAIGSDILEKVATHYPDLNLNWLVTGKGKMLQKPLEINKNSDGDEYVMMDDGITYKVRHKLINVLKEQLRQLESTIPASKKTSKSRPKKPGSKKN